MFSLLGAFASGLGSPWGPYLPVLRRAAGILTMAFGLVLNSRSGGRAWIS